MRKPLGILLLICGVLIVLFVGYENSRVSKRTRVFSSYTLLSSSWDNYKTQFIQSNGQSLDPSQQNITTSEGQGYAMLRAVWVDDKSTFDKVYSFTQSHMKRPHDNLFGWRYGKLPNGKSGFVSGGGDNSAADADSDIAYALLLASKRWNNPKYQTDALPIIKDMWRYETASGSGGKRYVIAGNWAQNSQRMIINVSYFAPYEWREFATVDKQDDWQSLLNPAYQLLTDAGEASLDKAKGVGLPPDWMAMNRQTGQLSVANLSNLTTNYSFDAMRTPWRIALDYQWYKDPHDLDYLKNSYALLAQNYEKNHKLASTYAHDGSQLTTVENPAMYATALGYFMVTNKSLATQMYQDKIIRLYSNDQNTFDKNLPYYEQNWLWFGAALYNNFLSHFNS
ncbi:MAG: glycosyl hydrolase family 8 [Candidatus Levyibacteriota bacterium]